MYAADLARNLLFSILSINALVTMGSGCKHRSVERKKIIARKLQPKSSHMLRSRLEDDRVVRHAEVTTLDTLAGSASSSVYPKYPG